MKLAVVEDCPIALCADCSYISLASVKHTVLIAASVF